MVTITLVGGAANRRGRTAESDPLVAGGVPDQAGAVRLVEETGKPIAQVARDLGINESTLGNLASKARRALESGNGGLSESKRAELERSLHDNIELRCGVMSSSARWPSG